MKQVRTTIILSAFAVASLITALSVYYFAPNEEDGQNELIGEVFYPEFTDPVQASSLKLIVWDGKDKKTIEFDVKKVKQTRTIDGEQKEVELWAIPDHNNYPVESPERLRETAGSIMNIERLSLASNAKEEHERLGVIDPYDENAKLKEPNEVGDRIILKDDSGNTVCDLIIGNAVDAESENQISNEKRELVKGERYYVRQPDENETYIAQLDLQITTEFSEWIDDDLLQIKEATVNKIQFLNYEVEKKLIEKFGGMVPVRQNFEDFIVQKENGTWIIDDLKSDTEELDTQPLNSLENDFRSLSILEVEPKPTYQDNDMKILNADLTVNAPPGMSRNDQIRIQSQVLGPQGFIVGLEDEKKVTPSLLSTNGELKVATDDGLVYHLFFGYDVKLRGESFEFATKDDESKDEGKGKEAKSKELEKDKEKIRNGKIMSVHVSFDPDLIEKPEAPVKPIKPARPDLGLPAPEKSPNTDDKNKAPGKKQPETPKQDSPSAPEKDSQPKAEVNGNSGNKKSEDPPKSKDEKTPDKKNNEAEKPKADAPEKQSDTPTEKDKKEPTSIEQEPSFGFSNVSLLTRQEKETPEKTDSKNQESGKETAPEKKSTDSKSDPKKDQEKKSQEDKKADKPKSSDDQEKSKPDPGKSTTGDQKKTDDASKNPAKQDPAKQDPAKQEPKLPMKSPEEIFTEKMAAYDQAMKQYEMEMETYEEELKQYEKALEEYKKKVDDNRKKVAELNARFADWFYIVDAKDLEKVKLSRATLVKPKPKTDPNQPPRGLPPGFNLPGGNTIPNLNNFPGGNPAGDPDAKKSEPKKSEPKKSEPKKSEPKKSEPKSIPDAKKSIDEPGKSGKKDDDSTDTPGDSKKSVDIEKTKVKSGESKSAADSNKSEPEKSQPKTKSEKEGQK